MITSPETIAKPLAGRIRSSTGDTKTANLKTPWNDNPELSCDADNVVTAGYAKCKKCGCTQFKGPAPKACESCGHAYADHGD